MPRKGARKAPRDTDKQAKEVPKVTDEQLRKAIEKEHRRGAPEPPEMGKPEDITAKEAGGEEGEEGEETDEDLSSMAVTIETHLAAGYIIYKWFDNSIQKDRGRLYRQGEKPITFAWSPEYDKYLSIPKTREPKKKVTPKLPETQAKEAVYKTIGKDMVEQATEGTEMTLALGRKALELSPIAHNFGCDVGTFIDRLLATFFKAREQWVDRGELPPADKRAQRLDMYKAITIYNAMTDDPIDPEIFKLVLIIDEAEKMEGRAGQVQAAS